ncbi:MAG: hypothetical protein IT410_01645 [Candidatus Doudnabacteria bacterium]|nr:hypothetical protein [Candidatus Doudnabacteria bacterium]
MGNKNILLWVIAVIALVLSTIAIVAPRGQQSDAAYSNLTATQSETLYQGGGGEVRPAPQKCTYIGSDGMAHIGIVERDNFSGKDLCVDGDGRTHVIRDYVRL